MIKLSKNIKQPLVTIYIVSHNYGEYIAKSIKSVLDQTYKNWELFIINDNSKDSTKKISNKFLKKNKKIKEIINFKKKTGLQHIANKILSICEGEYILRLDADDWLNENALLLLVNKALTNKKIGAVFGNFLFTNENGKIIGYDSEINIQNFEKNKIIAPHGACTLFKTNELKKIGGYSEEIKSQDGWEIWYKLKERNQIKSVNNIIFYYRQHSKSISKKRNLLISRNKIIEKVSKSSFGGYNLKSLAIVPIKENYKDIKNIPFLKYKNKSLIDRTLESVCSAKIDNIIVSTSSKKVISYLKKKKYKKKILIFKRDKNLKDSILSIEDILISSTKKFINTKKISPDIVFFFSLHTIRFDNSYVNTAIDLFKFNKFDTIYSVTKEQNPTFKFDGEKFFLLNRGRFKNLDYLSQKVVRFNGSFIGTWWRSLKNNQMFGKNFGVIEINDNDFLQINNISRFFK
jgi:glycosyltransferase involved in cell wall biosynthesis